MYPVRIKGTGSYLPKALLTNADFEKIVNTSDEWIVERTGIRIRHKAAKNECTSDLCLKASLKALEASKLEPKDLDMIIVATITPDHIMPSTSCFLQSKLKAPKCMAFDLLAACSGFIYAFSIASEFISSGRFENVLVAGGEVLHHIVDYEDRKTCVLFGDGAGAAVLSSSSSKSKLKEEEEENSYVFSHHMKADGSKSELFSLPAGGSAMPFSQETLDNRLHYIKMTNTRNIFKEAVMTMSNDAKEALDANHLTIDDVDWLIPHQANERIIQAIIKHLNFSPEKVIIELEDMGNTSAATIPISLDRAIRDGRIQRGHIVLLVAFGAGVTSGSLLLRY